MENQQLQKRNEHTYVAIMAGGIGSRFWPMSRVSHPKQFIDILGSGKTLIQQTFERFSPFVPVENIYVITANEYTDITREQLPELPEENILSEPSRKNTAPCIAYISFKLAQKDPDASIIIAPADHLIHNVDKFLAVCSEALCFANQHDALVTLGIKPTYPNTGYGYIQHNSEEATPSIYKVKTFTEKPNLELAKTFLASGDFLWNAGIFVWKVSRGIEAFHHFLPEMYEVFTAEEDKFNTPEEKAAIEAIYPQCTNISIDFGILEKADNVYVIPASFGWSDLGTWNSAWENGERDYLGNAVSGKHVMIIDATKCVVHAPDEKLVVVQGLDDFIVVDTKDALLICHKEKEQEIKEYVADVKRNMGDKFL
ncbi:MAG: mannose-1-phosphate guanylyltransferase [Bacteroidota bacterium]|nr:mannose-1-phosphate guanylyltransferase [Flavisolibacter sp.]MDQ3847228.1 mannose-1-phosphate guanylyltransferase [Bacteroidota bacterium]MBD0297178.1 mannose-1-phosphate guanylyltransferase [Flavisolibacter sp.]MBD0349987.1 mannose-1-phosphate guanylyltransferase [Flavisolibacter sp.]MBD0366105.1 mannose-1-phosphate guanylyltransferase [Flavisolibacter sp.]